MDPSKREIRAARRWRRKLTLRFTAGYCDGPHYERWCYCAYCPHTISLLPHWRRPDCPEPSEYVSALKTDR